ncbi:antibiotic biosynthesis monooxygenase [uncultured Methanobacterium sp.]|uniref:putative quinol monooxygenase n=1 Tax=uncultured Methanobacterium sp. TaxID=176306 RepID=UPI002AA86AAC|nr:antibiotic biosynthesis monooxygenase [uncultured Methanobacterium sp.]
MITGTITAKHGHKNILIEKSQYLIEYARLKPGCVSYHVYRSTENKDFLLRVDHWNTEVLEVNMQTEHFNVFCVAIEDIIIEKIGTGIYSADKML